MVADNPGGTAFRHTLFDVFSPTSKTTPDPYLIPYPCKLNRHRLAEFAQRNAGPTHPLGAEAILPAREPIIPVALPSPSLRRPEQRSTALWWRQVMRRRRGAETTKPPARRREPLSPPPCRRPVALCARPLTRPHLHRGAHTCAKFALDWKYQRDIVFIRKLCNQM